MNSHPIPTDAGYSPPVTVDLVLHGERYEVSSVDSDQVILCHPRKAPPGHGVIRLTIDDHAILYHVDLFNGIDPMTLEQSFRVLDAAQNAA